MPSADELQRRAPRRQRGQRVSTSVSGGDPADAAPPSKTHRKAEMHSLQDLGEALVALEPERLDQLAREAALPERLVDAVREARAITAWGGRRRQLQFIGRLMRDVDPEPIRQRLALWSHGHALEARQQHALETWRERLLTEAGALDALAAVYPRLDRARLRTLAARARDERARGASPHAYRELYRELRSLAAERGE
jgi:ribosome-associated protein